MICTAPAATSTSAFDRSDPAHLEAFKHDLSARTGREWVVPAPFEWPDDPSDPNTTWRFDPTAAPSVRTYDRANGKVIDVSFPAADQFVISGIGYGPGFHRSGRYSEVGPAALAWVLARILERMAGQ